MGCLPLLSSAQDALPLSLLTGKDPITDLIPPAWVFTDSSKDINLQQAWQLLHHGRYTPVETFQKPGKFRFGQYYYWLAFVVENPSADTLSMVVESRGLDTIWSRTGGHFRRIFFPNLIPGKDELGILPYDVKSINTFKVYPHSRDTVLAKLRHYKAFDLFAPRLYRAENYEASRLQDVKYTNLLYLFFLGMSSIVMVFAAAQYVKQRDPVFLWYALYLFSLIFVSWRNVEDDNPDLYSTFYLAPWFWTKVFHTAAHFITYTLFIYYFLKQDNELPAFMRWVRRWALRLSALACFIELVLLYTDLRHESWLLYYFFRMTMTVFSFVFLFLLWRERSKLAHIVLLGTLCVIVAEFVSLFLPAPISTFAGAVGVFAEIIFLTMGLAYRAQLFQKAHQRLQAQHIVQLEENERLREIARREEIEAFKNLFYANITHEFRTPLTVILGMAESLVASADRAVGKAGKLITRNGQGLLNLVNQLLDLSKMESGKLVLNPSRADLMRFIKVCGESLSSLADLKNQQLRIYTDPKQLWTDFDADRLQQVLNNLISNAIKFTPEGGSISLSARLNTAQELEIKVTDTGIGMDEETLDHIFDRFYQTRSSARTTGMHQANQPLGSGIGLALVDELVRLMDGTIKVESQLGMGSTFQLNLPIIVQSPPAIPAGKVPEYSASATVLADIEPQQPPTNALWPHTPSDAPLLLLVEDSQDLITYLSELLGQTYHLITAQNGVEGLEKAFEQLPDVVLSDVMMPEMGGLEFCKRLKDDQRTSHIPVVMLTARTAVEARIEGLQSGADAWLSKPFHQAELLATLAAMLESRQRLQLYFQQATPTEPEASIAPLVAKEHEFLQGVRTLLDAHIHDERYDIEMLCRDLALSRMQLHRKLSALSGQSTALFIRAHRLRHARHLLETTELTISEIAYDSGFSDPAYFSRCFREEFGIPPSGVKRG